MRWDRTKGRPEPVAALDRVPLTECGEPLVPLAEFAPSIRLVRPQTIPFCRKTVAEMVERAARLLPAGYHLAVTDAWRPLLRQQMIYEFMSRSAKEAFPEREGATLTRTVNRWVAPPNRKSPPGHCTGAALDVILVDHENEPIDVTSPYTRLHGGPTYVFGLTETAQRNRMILVDVMLSVGFSNCRDEWWHYSYGDAGWAVRLDRPTCFYGAVELDPSFYLEAQRIWEEALRDRPNPFLES
ncbi:MAG: hypothetical protein IT363_05915 [Methanoregulaceae archaeon]|nr:hypothetical protein [Methanoregulaceae archaeon]